MSQVAERVNNASPHAARYIADYHGAASSSQPAWLTNLRESAIASFERLGFPTTRLEQWRFTSVTPISEKAFALATGGVGRHAPRPDPPSLRGAAASALRHPALST